MWPSLADPSVTDKEKPKVTLYFTPTEERIVGWYSIISYHISIDPGDCEGLPNQCLLLNNNAYF